MFCAVFLLALGACSGGAETTDTLQNDQSDDSTAPQGGQALSASDTALRRPAAEIDLTDAAVITLSGDTASAEGGGVQVDGGVITVTSGGVYAVSGRLDEGRIIVNAAGETVTLALNGASVTCSYGSPIYIYKSASTTVHLVEGTENYLADGTAYTFADSLSSAADEEPNACLYSKSDLVVEGAGRLTVEANYNNGITSKDTLQIYDADLTVTAVNHGINGKDSNTIDSAGITVRCGGDAIRSTNDTDDGLGWISVSNSQLDLTAGEDGIQAGTWAALSSGSYTISTGGGCKETLAADASAKGIKAGTALTLASGVYTMDCCDDAFHANGSVTVTGGVYTVSTGDDAFHADDTLAVSGGTIGVLESYEGLEGTQVEISGGEITVTASDDGVNAAGGADASGFGGRGMGNTNANTFAGSGGACSMTVSGGTLQVLAGGDGLDANGSITMTGGTVLVSSTGGGDSALDYDGSFSLSGGTLLAACTGDMAQAPTEPAQYTMAVRPDNTLEAGTCIQIAGSGAEWVFRLPAPAGHIVFSAPELQSGETYSISCGGTYSQDGTGMLCTGGAYTGGTVLTELTITDSLTTYGQVNVGGSKGGNRVGKEGQKGSFGFNGTESPDQMRPALPEAPEDGTVPEGRPEMPGRKGTQAP